MIELDENVIRLISAKASKIKTYTAANRHPVTYPLVKIVLSTIKISTLFNSISNE